ncbi:alpha/beta fold hydrolase [Halobaculum marinum]|uniref:Alpha/beta fold hydrolase n=1 Tax=Halobaculum marinum TaxID=3031996 RepID=A0ABD5WZJ0_9EURY|nr:alpha/beta hydrolase [Halobaculum sp. DT55]
MTATGTTGDADGVEASDDATATLGHRVARSVESVSVTERGTVSYAEYGDPDGSPAVFLHGTPGSRVLAALFDDAAREFGVRVVSVDRPGYGRSTPWPSRSLADTETFVEAVLDDVGVDRAGVVAFSGGGPHALALAATAPDRVREVDVVSGAVPTASGVDTPTPIRVLGTLARRTPRLLGTLLRGQAWLAGRASPAVVLAQYTTGDEHELTDREAAIVRRDFVTAFDRGAAGAVTELATTTGEWDIPLEAVECPVRLWHGDDDTNVPLAGAERLAARLPTAVVHQIEGADHLGTLVRSRSAVLRHQCEHDG